MGESGGIILQKSRSPIFCKIEGTPEPMGFLGATCQRLLAHSNGKSVFESAILPFPKSPENVETQASRAVRGKQFRR